MLFAAIAAGATVLTLAMPLLARDNLSTRMKAVAFEREKIRQRERERLGLGNKVSLRQSPKAYMNTVVKNFNLGKWVGQESARKMLVQAGYRGHAPYVTYLFFRMLMPIAMLLISAFYVFVVAQSRSADDDKDRYFYRRRLFRHVEPESVSQKQDHTPAGFD